MKLDLKAPKKKNFGKAAIAPGFDKIAQMVAKKAGGKVKESNE
jgi:hypothetical protein